MPKLIYNLNIFPSMQFLMGARRMEELVCFFRLGPCSGIRGRLLRAPSLACFSRLGRLQMLPTLDPGRLERYSFPGRLGESEPDNGE